MTPERRLSWVSHLTAAPVRASYESCAGAVGGRPARSRSRLATWQARHGRPHSSPEPADSSARSWSRSSRPEATGVRSRAVAGSRAAGASSRSGPGHRRPPRAGAVAGRGGGRLGVPSSTAPVCTDACITRRRAASIAQRARADGRAPAGRRGGRADAADRVRRRHELLRRDGPACGHRGRTASSVRMGTLPRARARSPRRLHRRRPADRHRVSRLGLRQRLVVSQTGDRAGHRRPPCSCSSAGPARGCRPFTSTTAPARSCTSPITAKLAAAISWSTPIQSGCTSSPRPSPVSRFVRCASGGCPQRPTRLAVGPVLASYVRDDAVFSNIRLRGIGFRFSYPTLEDGLQQVLGTLHE